MKRITENDISGLFELRPRRHKFCDPPRSEPLGPPDATRSDWILQFPFEESFWADFKAAVEIRTIGIRTGKNGGHYTFLKPAFPVQIDAVRKWITRVSPYVGIRDLLDASFALDYERENGDPDRPQTEIGRLRSRAKVYDTATQRPDVAAIDDLALRMARAFGDLAILRRATCVVAVPPSSPDKPFVLPREIASRLATKVGLPFLPSAVRTTKIRPQAKNLTVAGKLGALSGTVRCDANALKRQRILLIDDLYQSGATLNYVAMMLADAGAESVYGLVCEKTCTNDDNVSRKA
jgi:hypothetical protein